MLGIEYVPHNQRHTYKVNSNIDLVTMVSTIESKLQYPDHPKSTRNVTSNRNAGQTSQPASKTRSEHELAQ